MQTTRLNLEFALIILPNVAANRYTALNNAQHLRPPPRKAKAVLSIAILETVKLFAKLVSLTATELVQPVMIQDLSEEME